MTSPGSIPSLPRLPGQANPVSAQSPPNAQIIKVPEKLQDIRDVLLVRAIVSESKPDGTVKVETPQGTIELKLPPQIRPPEGQAVEIEIQPGRPPQTARVEAEHRIEHATERVTPRTADTPVDIRLERPDIKLTAPQYTPEQNAERAEAPPQSLPLGQVIRLEPVPAAQIPDLLIEPLEIITSSLQEAIAFEVRTISEQAVNSLVPGSAPQATIRTVVAAQPPQKIFPESFSLKAASDIRNPVFFAANHFAPPLSTTPAVTLEFATPDLSFAKTSTAPAATTLDSVFLTLPDFTTQQGIAPVLKTALPGLLHPAELALASVDGITAFFTPNRAPTATVPLKAETFNASFVAAQDVSVRFIAPETMPGTQTIQTILTKPSPLIVSSQQAGALNGTVIGSTKDNLPLIHFFTQETAGKIPGDVFFLTHAPASLTPGAEIIFIPQNTQNTGLVMAAAIPVASAPLSFMAAEPWPLLDEILEVLTQASPLAARAFSNVIPSPASPAQLGPAALFFIAAVRGNVTQWMSDKATDILRRDSRSLMTRLAGEGSTLSRMMSEPAAQDWRGVHIPLYWEGDVHKLSLHYKHEFHDEKDGKPGSKQVRFIFDMALDSMGKVQLDGLFRGKKLDLIVRSQQPFSPAMQNRMRLAYINALEPTEIKGELSFQNKIEQWVTITASTKQKFGTSA